MTAEAEGEGSRESGAVPDPVESERNELALPAPCLVVLVGPSGSGKTTWAHEHFDPPAIVSTDRLRAVVGQGEDDLDASVDAFALADTIVEQRLYQLIRQPKPVAERRFEIEFLEPGVAAYAFTFG